MTKCPHPATLPEGKRVLTLDIASAIGFAYGIGGVVLCYGKHTSEDDTPIGQRLLNFSKWLTEIFEDLPAPPEIVIVEQPYLGRNPKTHAVLNRYIGIAQREVRSTFGLECEFMSPKLVKHTLGFPKRKTHDQYKKMMVVLVNDLLGLNLQYKASRTKKAKQSDDDIADAIGIMFAYWHIQGVVDLERGK